ncbi:ShlB/FhaC/HecB family hemolysin secretion/activation protein [Sulfitobacter sp. TSTF-M16]|uniref:ShlB/FhaC/HecB family hemolysin secretion/activation protein n=2 Tax=Sulfitobacter aestuariivivens TaxID=2766981 RepID=A0A927D060_9RHOB|nr:ShlB/FhaC/HecB family hemolysin secretion/activation protein [Sulfitobacter aestuariivivens]MBD3662615.1 ShlB/FhaC/HecB family hemolysin secretion/activation protein [Sulfitobacter aestuariivivens]
MSTSAGAQSRSVSLDGVTAYDPQALLEFATQVSLSRYGVVDVSTLIDVIEVIYREDGYFLAEVFLEPNGTSLFVDEGSIGSVVIEGSDADAASLIMRYMQPLLETRPTTLTDFERALMLSDDIGSVSVTAEVAYPDPNGPAELRVVAIDEQRSSGFITLDHPARELGNEATLTFGQTFLSAFTPGDLLGIELSGTSDFSGDDTLFGALRYRLPLGGSGAYAETYLGNVGARRDVDGALQETDIAGRTAIFALGYPVLRDIDTYGYGLLEFRHSSTEIDVAGEEFDSEINAISATWIYGKAFENGAAWEYAASLTYGARASDLDGFTDGDESFTHLRFGAGVNVPNNWLGEHSYLHAEFWGQVTNNELPSAEQFYIGGRFDERGYRFAEAQGDSGLSATVSIGRDLFPNSAAVERMRPFIFADVGYVVRNSDDGDDTFASLGVGLDTHFTNNLFATTHVAVPLTDGPTTNEHDPSLYIGLTRSW